MDIIEYLVEEKNANINQIYRLGRTSLIYACQQGYFHMVEYLMDHQADINIYNNGDWDKKLLGFISL